MTTKTKEKKTKNKKQKSPQKRFFVFFI